jgi:hypothetical protein
MREIIAWLSTMAAITLLWPAQVPADDDPFAEGVVDTNRQAGRALILCGLPGDAEHRKLFAETVEKLYAGLTTRLGFAEERVAVLFSDETGPMDGPALRNSRGMATREKVAEVVSEVEASLKPEDSLWVFVLGHAHFDGRVTWLNLPGPDLNQMEFGKLFSGFSCREQLFFITTPVSGFFIKPLSTAGRIVVSATEADAEVNETIFPAKLAVALGEPHELAEFDIDGDGRATLFDAYLWSARETAQEYASGELLATEHSLLDDNGDGRGSEVQLDYLSEDLGGRVRAGRKPTPHSGDGGRARSINLPVEMRSAPLEPAKAAP